MIGYLTGKVIRKRDKGLIVDVQGIGYKVAVHPRLLEKAETHLPIELHIHTVVREDDISLYGFEEEEELKLFELLLTVNGVGPRVGMDLFTWPIEKVKSAIASKDVALLTQLPGIGKKTSERIILELKDKLDVDLSTLTEVKSEPEVSDEVLDALLSLGYQQRDIKRIFQKRAEPATTSEEMIKYFLRNV